MILNEFWPFEFSEEKGFVFEFTLNGQVRTGTVRDHNIGDLDRIFGQYSEEVLEGIEDFVILTSLGSVWAKEVTLMNGEPSDVTFEECCGLLRQVLKWYVNKQ